MKPLHRFFPILCLLSLLLPLAPSRADIVAGYDAGTAGTPAVAPDPTTQGWSDSGGAAATVSPPVALSLARVFGSHMVLQRGTNVPVWGKAEANAQVSVTFGGQVKNATADGAGNWSAALDPMLSNTNGRPLVVSSGVETNTLTDVLVGEVWLAAGQSNMRWAVDQSSTAPHPEQYDLIRMCNWEGSVGIRQVYDAADFAQLTPEGFYVGAWERIDAGSVGPQSAVAYFYANALARELRGTGPGGADVPVGVFELAIGGTSTEAFIAPEAHTNAYLKAAFEDPRGTRTLGQWTSPIIESDLTGYTHTDPALPHPHPFAPGFLFHVGIRHTAPFPFRGAIWYQGESNAEFTTDKYRWNGARLSDYQAMVMKSLVDSWRDAFGRADLPFYMVQLPRISASNRVQWPWYREAQSRVARDLEGVEIAVVTEFGVNGSNVHPANKEPVGERLALIARNRVYGESVAYAGPLYQSQERAGGKIVLRFVHTGEGLLSQDGQPLRHFEIAGEDRAFAPAVATIVSNTVEVATAAVPRPVAVRYGWNMNIDVNFYASNAVGNLPASPFRTDEWMAAPGRAIRVACIGDSITYGSTITNRATDAYPPQLAGILGTSNFEVGNFGKPGAGVYRLANKYQGSAPYAAAIAYNPDVVICNLGINDITEWGAYTRAHYLEAYRDLVDAFASLGTDPLFILWHEIGPLFPGQAFYGDPGIPVLNDWILASAGLTGARTVDMYDHFRDHPEWYAADHIHPNETGAREIAEETLRYLAVAPAM